MSKLVGNLKVRELNVNDYHKWDELVDISPQGTIFHSSDYLTICDEFLDGKLTIFGCFKGDDQALYPCQKKWIRCNGKIQNR